jgi:hypothetical protein
MAISPSLVFKSTTDVDTDLVNKTEKTIDEKLSDPAFVKQWQCGGDGDYHWKFSIEGIFSQADKEEIISRYTAAGWSRVEVTNSSELGQLSGKCLITLYY